MGTNMFLKIRDCGAATFIVLLFLAVALPHNAQAQEPVQSLDTAVVAPYIEKPVASPVIKPEISGYDRQRDFNVTEIQDAGMPEVEQLPAFPQLHVVATDTAVAKNMVRSSYPLADDFSRSGNMASWNGGFLTGAASHTTMPWLLSKHGISLEVVQTAGRFTFSTGLSASRFYLGGRGTGNGPGLPLLNGVGFGFGGGVKDLYGIGGSVSYTFNDNLSATVFGQYYNSFYHSMAAMPYIGTSSYGGYMTWTGGRAEIDLGAERRYDPFSRSWYVSPIVTPKIKINNKVKFGFPVGELVRTILERTVFK